MSDDICDRLVRFSPHKQCMSTDLEVEAASEITRLREENARLRAVLKPFADAAEGFRDEVSDEYPFQFGDFRLGQCRAAAAAIREGGKDGKI